MPAAVMDELAVQPPQEPENVADDHWEQIINNLSDEDIPLPKAPQIPGQNIPKPSTSSASERKRQIDNELQHIEAPKAKKPKSVSLIVTIKQNHMDYRAPDGRQQHSLVLEVVGPLVHPQMLQASDLEWAF
jgi:hypothetical protein